MPDRQADAATFHFISADSVVVTPGRGVPAPGRLDLSVLRPASLDVAGFEKLPRTFFRYIVMTSWRHQLILCLQTAVVFLMDVVPLELQRRVITW